MNVAAAPSLGYSADMISAKQIRAARSLIGWTQEELATAAGLSLAVVNNVERSATDSRRSTIEKIQRALEAAGIEFLAQYQSSLGGGEGVRLRQNQ